MRIAASLVTIFGSIVVLGACSSPSPKTLSSDTVLGVHVGMSRREVRRSFAPRGEGKWYELESVAGESRLRWAADGADATPQSVDVNIGTDGKVRELVFALRPDDAKKVISDLGGGTPSGLVRYGGPSGDVIVAPGLGSWTLRLAAK